MEGVGFFEIFAGALSGFYGLIPSYGLAIILLTIAVRLLLLPLSIKQTRSMREMQRIQPEIKRLQKKHKGDRQKLNEEMMALYKEHGVNPLGGCLPLLLQMPVFIALFNVLRSPLKYLTPFAEGALATALAIPDQAVRLNSFLGIHLNCLPQQILSPDTPEELASMSSVERALSESCGSGFVTALPYLFLVALMGFTTYYQSKQMQAKSGGSSDDPAQKQMQMMGKIFPVMLMFFSFTFPAGLTIYWLTTNVWTIGQQRLMLKAAPPLPPIGSDGTTKASKPATKPEPGKPPRKSTGRPESQTRSATPKPHPRKKKR